MPFVRGRCGGPPATSEHNCSNSEFVDASSTAPFWDAAMAPWDLAVATRGVYGPILPVPPTCTPIAGCTRYAGDTLAQIQAAAANADRITQPRNCESTTTQIKGYVDEIIGGNPFLLVR